MTRLHKLSKVEIRKNHKKPKDLLVAWAKKQKQKTLNFNALSQSKIPLQCPLVGCSGAGHLGGLEQSHVTLSACPNYHNISFEKCAEMRAREEGLVSPVQSKPSQSVHISPNKSTKCQLIERSQQFRTTMREPLFESLANPMEIYQFRCAQQRLISDPEREAKEHLLICARIASHCGNSFKSCGGTENPDCALEQRIRSVIFGDWKLCPVYGSQYPADIACLPEIFICSFCLTPVRHRISYNRHRLKCTWFLPPGDEIYRKDNLSFFEVDGKKYPTYCSNLCLLTKLFLKQKTVYDLEQVTSFLFYVLTEETDQGFNIIGYFSKQKPEEQTDLTGSSSAIFNNLSCILILPPYQCRGYGRMLIEFSYVLSRLENRIGSPERPLSDLGLIIYRKYWRWEILQFLSRYAEKCISMRAMSHELFIAIPDIVSTLLDMQLLIYYRTQYYIINKKAEVDRLLKEMKSPDDSRRIDRSCLHWTPHFVRSATKGGRVQTADSNSVDCKQ